MSKLILFSLGVGLVILLGFLMLHFRRPENEDESHIRVGKEWMTVAEYKKRYFSKSK